MEELTKEQQQMFETLVLSGYSERTARELAIDWYDAEPEAEPEPA